MIIVKCYDCKSEETVKCNMLGKKCNECHGRLIHYRKILVGRKNSKINTTINKLRNNK